MILELCKGVHCVDLGESSPHVPFLNLLFEQIAIPTSIYLLSLASIQPRTSPLKFVRSSGKLQGWEYSVRALCLRPIPRALGESLVREGVGKRGRFPFFFSGIFRQSISPRSASIEPRCGLQKSSKLIQNSKIHNREK